MARPMEAPSQEARIELRPMTREDLPAVVALAHAEGRNVHRSEYDRFVGLEGAHGFVLYRDGALVGAVTAMRYFENGFLGPVVLGSGPGSVGVSILLLQRAIETLQRGGVALLDAEAGDVEAAVLSGLGFQALRRTLVLERPAAAPTGRLSLSTPMEPRHFLDIGALDAEVVGHGRKEFLLSLMEETPAGARVVERDGDVAGYVLVRRSRRGYHLGPLVTRTGDEEAAQALLADALESVAGWPVVALAPEGSPLLDLLRARGFAEVGGLTRMRTGVPGRAVEETAGPAATEWLVGSRITG